jgi:hypothetical protein
VPFSLIPGGREWLAVVGLQSPRTTMLRAMVAAGHSGWIYVMIGRIH